MNKVNIEVDPDKGYAEIYINNFAAYRGQLAELSTSAIVDIFCHLKDTVILTKEVSYSEPDQND